MGISDRDYAKAKARAQYHEWLNTSDEPKSRRPRWQQVVVWVMVAGFVAGLLVPLFSR